MLRWAPAILVSTNLREFWKDSFWDEDLRSRMENHECMNLEIFTIYFGTIFADLVEIYVIQVDYMLAKLVFG